MPIASDDEKRVDQQHAAGGGASRPSFVSSLHITPRRAMISTSDEMSQRPGSASSARSIGLANASPTMAIALTRSRSIVSSSSSTSKCRPLERHDRAAAGDSVDAR